MKFLCSGYDASGRALRETIDAPDQAAAVDALRRRGLFVTECESADAELDEAQADIDLPTRADHAPFHERIRFAFGRGRRLKHVSGFLRQLSVLVATGTPLADAVLSLERQASEEEWRGVLVRIRHALEEGRGFHEALTEHPEHFDAVCCSLVAAGEQGGNLQAMLDRLSKLARQQQKIRSTLRGAMVYPALLVVVSIVVLMAMLLFVMPRFEGLFKTLNAPLPPTTKALMWLSGAIVTYWYAAAAGVLALIAAVTYAVVGSAAAQIRQRLAVTAPVVGKVTRSFVTARIARVLGVLLEGKVPLLDAIKLTRRASGNIMYAALLARVEQAVTKGDSVSNSLADSALVDPAIVEALRSGERTGQVAPVLLSVADFMDEDNEVLLRSVTSIIEPLILIVLGLLVGAMAVSMFLPLFDLTAAGSGGAA